MNTSQPTQNPPDALRPTSWAMKRLGYTNRGAFWTFVHAAGVPHIKLNSRTGRFDERALNAWLERRTVGGAA